MLFAYALRVYWFGIGVLLLIHKMRDEAFMRKLETPADRFWAAFYILFVMPWLRLITRIKLFPLWLKIQWISLLLRFTKMHEESYDNESDEET